LSEDNAGFPTDQRPKFNCLRDNCNGPYMIGANFKGVACQVHYEQARVLNQWSNPWTMDDFVKTAKGMPK